MKSQREIQIEAATLRQNAAALQLAPAGFPGPTPSEVSTGPLMSMPEHLPLSGQSRYERFIDAVLSRNELTFRLMERQVPLNGPSTVMDDRPYMLNFGSAEDVLRAGYEMSEQESLKDRMDDFDFKRRSEEWDESESGRELEEVLQVDQLPPADCLRMKADISAFVEGRMPRHELILHSIRRQLTRDPLSESQTQTQSLRLTIDQP